MTNIWLQAASNLPSVLYHQTWCTFPKVHKDLTEEWTSSWAEMKKRPPEFQGPELGVVDLCVFHLNLDLHVNGVIAGQPALLRLGSDLYQCNGGSCLRGSPSSNNRKNISNPPLPPISRPSHWACVVGEATQSTRDTVDKRLLLIHSY